MIDFGYDLRLLPIERDDLQMLRRWRNDYRIWKWCRQNDLISEVSQQNWFERQAADPTMRMYKMCAPSGEAVGVCGLTSIDTLCRRAELSLYIEPARQKEGLGKRALSTLLCHGFVNMGLNLIWCETFEGNHAAKMFESSGFKKEGTRRQFYFKGGKFIDAHLYSITADEWLQGSLPAQR